MFFKPNTWIALFNSASVTLTKRIGNDKCVKVKIVKMKNPQKSQNTQKSKVKIHKIQSKEEKENTRLKHQSEQFVREWEPTKGGGALKRPAPLCRFFLSQNSSNCCLSLVFSFSSFDWNLCILTFWGFFIFYNYYFDTKYVKTWKTYRVFLIKVKNNLFSYSRCMQQKVNCHVIKVSFLGPISTLRHDTRICLMWTNVL